MFVVSWRNYDDERFTRTDVVRIEYAEVDETDSGGPVDDEQVLLWFDDGTGERFPFDELAEMSVRPWGKGWTKEIDRLMPVFEEMYGQRRPQGTESEAGENKLNERR